MYDMKKARCAQCPHYLFYQERAPERKHGITLQYGCRYCMAGKRARLFKRCDPKVYVPKWCPLRITPILLRIYSCGTGYASYRRDGLKRTVLDARGYALRCEGPAPHTGADFFILVRNREKLDYVPHGDVEEMLGVPFARHDVLEFYDGIKPFFYWRPRGRILKIMFDPMLAEAGAEIQQQKKGEVT